MSIKFSIITVCLNAGKALKKTVDSVLGQEYENIEMIIKDGGSSDGSLNLINKNEKINVIVARDKSLYDAMNQAIEYATGEFLLFLNAGDVFYNQTVLKDVSGCLEGELADVVYGDYCRGNVIVKQPNCMTSFSLFRNPLNHQSMFFLKESFLYEKWYRTEFRILADYELTVRSFVSGKRFLHIPVVIDDYEGAGVSESKKGLQLSRKEMKFIRKRYFEKEYIKYSVMIGITFPRLRGLMVSDRMPRIITSNYRKVTNFLNEHINK